MLTNLLPNTMKLISDIFRNGEYMCKFCQGQISGQSY